MAVVTRYLKPVGGVDTYTSIDAWQAGEQTDLVTPGDTHVLECHTGTYEGSTLISGWTTSPSNNITIKAAAGHEHNGVFGAGVLLQSSMVSAGVFTLQNDVGLTGLCLESRGATNGSCLLVSIGSTHRSLLVRRTGAADSVAGFSGFQPAAFYNCIFENFYKNFNLGNTTTCYNCTSIGGVYGGFVLDVANTPLTNCVAFGSSGGDFLLNKAPATIIGSGNASEDGSAGGTAPITGVTTADFYNYAGGDYRPVIGGVLDGVGTDLSGTFTDDVSGATRATWDIGAWIAVAAPPSGGGGGPSRAVAYSLVTRVAADIMS